MIDPVSRIRAAALASCGLLSAACASAPHGAVYVHPNADFSMYRRVAVLPLANLTTDRFAGERVREIICTELSMLRLFDTVDVGEVNRVMRVHDLADASAIGPEMIAALGSDLDVQGLLFGSVLEYRAQQTGSVTSPEVGLSLRLVDVETGMVVWSVGDARKGLSIWTRLFGVGEKSHSEVARDLVHDLMQQLLDTAGL